MKVCMVGTGYVGLVSGAGFAETGNDVTCVDIDEKKVDSLRSGHIPLYEPGLDDLVERNVKGKRLHFTTDGPKAIADADVVFVGVGTPSRIDGAADLNAVDRVVETVAEHVTKRTVLVLKSTVPVGTNQRATQMVEGASHPIEVVSNPEFLKEGDAVNDFMKPDRIIVGVRDGHEHAKKLMARIYRPVLMSQDRIVWMDPASAELTKYVSNTMLAMRISFMNEIALLCERVGANVHHVRRGVGRDARIGTKFLFAGPGYGGSCFPKDVSALAHTASELGLELALTNATERVNQNQKKVIARKLKHRFDGDLRGKRIALWGLAFKPRTDDIRESPATTLIEVLISEGAHVVGHDPAAAQNMKALFGEGITVVDDAYEALKDAHALAVVTEWQEYSNPDFVRIKSLMARPLIVDGRNIWTHHELWNSGFQYDGIGTIPVQ